MRTSGFVLWWYCSYTVSYEQGRGVAVCYKSAGKMGGLFLLLLRMYPNGRST